MGRGVTLTHRVRFCVGLPAGPEPATDPEGPCPNARVTRIESPVLIDRKVGEALEIQVGRLDVEGDCYMWLLSSRAPTHSWWGRHLSVAA